MTTAVSSMTAQELFELPPDHLRHELVRGELVTMPPTGDIHGARTGRITLRLGEFIDKHNLGLFFGAETGFLLARNPDTVRAPDFAFLSQARLAQQNLTGKFYPGAPDLAVEVLSPSDTASEVLEKIDAWLAAGTRMVWVVDPEKQTLTVYAPERQPRTLRLADTLQGEDVLPGFQLPLAEIFR
jgi:Uma2 family endonuclease